MKRVFISQPMNGKSDVEILMTRAEAAKAAQDHLGEEVEIMDTFWPNMRAHPLQLLARSLDNLAQADLAYFAKGWDQTRGCKIEHTCAVEYGINVLEAK